MGVKLPGGKNHGGTRGWKLPAVETSGQHNIYIYQENSFSLFSNLTDMINSVEIFLLFFDQNGIAYGFKTKQNSQHIQIKFNLEWKSYKY